jgi:hypothetical protein
VIPGIIAKKKAWLYTIASFVAIIPGITWLYTLAFFFAIIPSITWLYTVQRRKLLHKAR